MTVTESPYKPQTAWEKLHNAIVRDAPKRLAQALQRYGTGPLTQASHSGGGLLHLASGLGRAECVRHLIAAGDDPNRINQFTLTPLHLAVMNGHIETVRVLLEEGAVVNQQNEDGRSPLHFACAPEIFDPELAILLLRAGADPDLRDASEKLPLDIAPKDKKQALAVEVERVRLERLAEGAAQPESVADIEGLAL